MPSAEIRRRLVSASTMNACRVAGFSHSSRPMLMKFDFVWATISCSGCVADHEVDDQRRAREAVEVEDRVAVDVGLPLGHEVGRRERAPLT